MGRGRGKGKRLTVSNHDDAGSGEEEKIPAQKRRGRPQKPLKDEFDEEEMEKMMEEEDVVENGKNGKKRRRNSQLQQQAKEKQPDSVMKEENGVVAITNDPIKSNGFRQNGSRRKNKPRRAAEAGVECK
ncbi:unnamed protein product [Linum tenue]|uniref:Uncharacterized protein n=1 Tax=Linum tenue TaxID=586396 RepID=A0AAV0RDG1_9ROSI|nr:unnamed protein product [Linum tenue]